MFGVAGTSSALSCNSSAPFTSTAAAAAATPAPPSGSVPDSTASAWANAPPGPPPCPTAQTELCCSHVFSQSTSSLRVAFGFTAWLKSVAFSTSGPQPAQVQPPSLRKPTGTQPPLNLCRFCRFKAPCAIWNPESGAAFARCLATQSLTLPNDLAPLCRCMLNPFLGLVTDHHNTMKFTSVLQICISALRLQMNLPRIKTNALCSAAFAGRRSCQRRSLWRLRRLHARCARRTRRRPEPHAVMRRGRGERLRPAGRSDAAAVRARRLSPGERLRRKGDVRRQHQPLLAGHVGCRPGSAVRVGPIHAA